jgi:ketoreductase RED2
VAVVLSVLGCRGAVGYVANRDRAAAIVARIQANGGEADLFGHDLARESKVAAGFREQVAERTPLRRLVRPLEVARGVGSLVTASFVTGHVLVVDGGHLLNM